MVGLGYGEKVGRVGGKFGGLLGWLLLEDLGFPEKLWLVFLSKFPISTHCKSTSRDWCLVHCPR